MIARETKVEQSVQDYVREKLYGVLGFKAENVELLDSFPYDRFTKALDKTYVAAGFHFDDGGRQAELGSDLKERVYTIEFYVWGLTSTMGRGVATAVRDALDSDSVIPVKDIGISQAVIDVLPVNTVQAERIPVPNPKPWEHNIWIVRLKVDDTYNAALN